MWQHPWVLSAPIVCWALSSGLIGSQRLFAALSCFQMKELRPGGEVIYSVLGTPLTQLSFLQELHRTELCHGRDARGRGADAAALPPERGPNAQGAAEAGAYTAHGEWHLAQCGAATSKGLSAGAPQRSPRLKTRPEAEVPPSRGQAPPPKSCGIGHTPRSPGSAPGGSGSSLEPRVGAGYALEVQVPPSVRACSGSIV